MPTKDFHVTGTVTGDQGLATTLGGVDTNYVYLGLAGAAVANKGIRLAANGGYYEMSAAFGNLMLGEVTVISASGSGNNLLVTEGV